MAGAGLAGLAAAIGGRAHRAVGSAKGSIFDVQRTAIQGKYAADAQQRAHEHFNASLKNIHKIAGAGTNIHLDVDADGGHRVKMKTKQIGERYHGVQENQAIKDFRAQNKKPRGEAFTAGSQEHEGGAQAGGYGDHPNVFKVEPKAIGPGRKALPAPKEPFRKTREGGSDRVVGGPDTERTGSGAIPMGGSSDASKIHEESKWRPSTPPSRSNGPAFEAHLQNNEAKYLADRRAKQGSSN